MKKLLSFFLALTMIFPLSACSAAEEPENPSSAPSESSSAISVQETPDGGSSETEASGAEVSERGEEQGSHILVAYFSWADNAILAEDVDAVASPSVIPPGNVQQLGWTPAIHRWHRPEPERWLILSLGATWCSSMGNTTKIRRCLNWGRWFPGKNRSARWRGQLP